MTTGSTRQSGRGFDDRGIPPLSQDAYAMLSTANLLRIRGLWQEAIDKCMIAMQLSPGHAAAQSLLGDIYENMGQTDDAIRWYQLALDANPVSIADRKKLDRLVAERRAAQDTAVDTTVTGTILVQPPAAAPVAAALGLRIAAIVSMVAVVVVVAYALAVTPHHLRAASASTAPNVSTDPILLNQSGGIGLSDDTTGVVRDAAEQSLLQSLQGAMSPSDGARIVDAQSDPRSGRITLSLLADQTGAIPIQRDAILHAAATAALALQHSTITTGYSEWTIRYLVQPQGATPSISFIGDSSRAALSAAPSDLSTVTTAQIEALFSNEWWSPNVPAPAPPPNAS